MVLIEAKAVWRARVAAAVVVLVCTGMIQACRPSSRMAGPYTLIMEDRCQSDGILSSHLVLHSDGTYDQTHELARGDSLRIDGNHWTYSDGAVHLDGFRLIAQPVLRVNDKAENVLLDGDPSRPPLLRFRDSRCFYMGPK